MSTKEPSYVGGHGLLTGKRVVITAAAGSGIGSSTARRCLEEGARVVIHGLEKELGETVAAQLGQDKSTVHIEDLAVEGAPQRPRQQVVPATRGPHRPWGAPAAALLRRRRRVRQSPGV